MTKPNPKGRSKGDPKHVRLYGYILESYAYRNLSAPARALLVEFMFLYNGANNGELFMSWRDAAKAIRVRNHATAGKYLRELVEAGFIKERMKGSFNNKAHLASAYILTEYEFRTQAPTKEFMRIRPKASDKQRVENLYPSYLRSKPAGMIYIPDDWPVGAEN